MILNMARTSRRLSTTRWRRIPILSSVQYLFPYFRRQPKPSLCPYTIYNTPNTIHQKRMEVLALACFYFLCADNPAFFFFLCQQVSNHTNESTRLINSPISFAIKTIIYSSCQGPSAKRLRINPQAKQHIAYSIQKERRKNDAYKHTHTHTPCRIRLSVYHECVLV